MMDAATLGALFFLALVGPAFFGGTSVANPDDAPLKLVLAVVSAGGVGAVLTLMGRALWELAFPYAPRSHNDFRWKIPEKDRDDHEGADGTSTFHLEAAERVVTDRWFSRNHKYVIATARVFYGDAKDPIVQWVRRRYDAFVMAISSSVAIFLGVILGLLFLLGPDPGKQLLFDGILSLVAIATLVWAVGARNLAREMEAFWYELRAEPKADELVVTFGRPLQVPASENEKERAPVGERAARAALAAIGAVLDGPDSGAAGGRPQ